MLILLCLIDQRLMLICRTRGVKPHRTTGGTLALARNNVNVAECGRSHDDDESLTLAITSIPSEC